MLEEEKIFKFISSNIERYASRLGYTFIDGGIGYWEDNNGLEYEIATMKKERLKSCINFINRGIEGIDNDKISRDINARFKQITKTIDEDRVLKDSEIQVTDEIVNAMKNGLRKVLEDKKVELQRYV